jgi:hypothetical protein
MLTRDVDNIITVMYVPHLYLMFVYNVVSGCDADHSPPSSAEVKNE